jgi:hypothetical protein
LWVLAVKVHQVAFMLRLALRISFFSAIPDCVCVDPLIR